MVGPFQPVGQAVSHYLVLQKIGSGGTGVVYAAEDLRLARHVGPNKCYGVRPMRRSRFWNCGSERRLSNAGSTFK
jgi:serine/threonine protein kinase